MLYHDSSGSDYSLPQISEELSWASATARQPWSDPEATLHLEPPEQLWVSLGPSLEVTVIMLSHISAELLKKLRLGA